MSKPPYYFVRYVIIKRIAEILTTMLHAIFIWLFYLNFITLFDFFIRLTTINQISSIELNKDYKNFGQEILSFQTNEKIILLTNKNRMLNYLLENLAFIHIKIKFINYKFYFFCLYPGSKKYSIFNINQDF